MSSNNMWQEQDIADALERFQPQPSEHFYQTMQSAPWMTGSSRTQLRFLRHLVANRRWGLTMAVVSALLIIGTVLTAPPLQVLAQELLGLFTPASSDVVTPQQLEADISDVKTWRFDLSLAEAERVAGFEVWVPSALPAGYRLESFAYIPAEQTILSLYYHSSAAQALDPRRRPDFVLAQQLVTRATSRPGFRVGASAAIEVVPIGETSGEYVEGAWCGSSSESPLQWCASVNARTLRWRRGDFMFTLEATDGSPIRREEMIDLAAQLTPAAKK